MLQQHTRTKGKDVRSSNIIAGKAVANAVRTSLGPRGMDKLLQLADGKVLISNDGATILKSMKVLHPAGQMLVDLSQSQDVEAGDGTTTVVVLAGALLEACATLLSKGIHPTVIASSFYQAAEDTCKVYQDMSRPVDLTDKGGLKHAVDTCLSSKMVADHSELLSPMAVDSVLGVWDGTTPNVDLKDIRLVEQMGGTVDDTQLIDGLVLTKGTNKQAAGAPSNMKNAKIALIQFCLSAPKTDMDNNVVVQDYAAMDRLLREERKYILQQCKAIKKSGANVLLIQKSILRDAYNELSLHFLAKMGILVVTDIERTDVPFICRTLGCTPMAHVDQCTSDKLGQAEKVADVFLEGAATKVVQFTGVDATANTATGQHVPKPMTVLLRGSNPLVLGEATRSLHDAQCVVRSFIKQPYMIAGGGAAEAQAAFCLQANKENTISAVTKTTAGASAYCRQAFAEALEVIPYTLAENAGMKPVDVVTELRKQHAEGLVGAGINVKKAKVTDMFDLHVVQPLLVSTSAVRLATETVCMILKVDDLVVVA